MNKPYVKQYNDEGVLLNPITKNEPYVHQFASSRGKSQKEYIEYFHPLTGRYLGRVRAKGNNRANTSKRKGINSRNSLYL